MRYLLFLPQLRAWAGVAFGTAQAVRRQMAQPLADMDVAPMVLPSASGSIVCVGHAGVLSSSSSTAGPVARITEDDVAMQTLAVIDAAKQPGSESVRVESLDGVHMDTLVTMARGGALRLDRNEFHELCVARVETGIRHVSVQTIQGPK